MSAAFIEVSGLFKTYQMGSVTVNALAGVNLQIEVNSFCLVMGPSGSGKSTLLHLIGGLDRPSAGEIRVGDLAITLLDENNLARFRRRQVGFIFQSFNLVPNMNALENVALPMRFTRVGRRQRRDRALKLLESVDLMDRAHHRPTELSGGEQQRVAVARALVNHPPLILADEPTGNLDTVSGDSIMALLTRLHQEGATVLVVTHDPRMVRYASRVVNILDGRIVDQARTDPPPSGTVGESPTSTDQERNSR